MADPENFFIKIHSRMHCFQTLQLHTNGLVQQCQIDNKIE